MSTFTPNALPSPMACSIMLAQMADAQYDMLDAVSLQQPQLVRHKRFAIDRDQRFRDSFRQRSQASCQTAGKYGHR